MRKHFPSIPLSQRSLRLFRVRSTRSTSYCIIKANKEAAPNNASTIKKICILPRDFSVATNELTPTLKLKRGVVVKMNQAAVDAIYNAPKNMTVVPYPITLSEKNSEPSKEE